MASQSHINCSILFSDIAGSTRLYEELGNQKAQKLVAQTLAMMEAKSKQQGGRVIKTIGDEIMCCFDSADQAAKAAIAMQEAVSSSPAEPPITLRIGFHHDTVLQQGDDLFGDGVNIAARMTQIARASQIVITTPAYDNLSPALRTVCRAVDYAPVKGKTEPIRIYEVMWEAEEDMTCIANESQMQHLASSQQTLLTLHYKNQQYPVPSESSLMIGRSPQAGLFVSSTLASRCHSIVEFRRGKYWYIDQSTNGSYVRTQDGKEVSLRREELPLWGQGQISLGGPIADNIEELIHFVCEDS